MQDSLRGQITVGGSTCGPQHVNVHLHVLTTCLACKVHILRKLLWDTGPDINCLCVALMGQLLARG